jgi:hypothetical protein
MMTLPGSVEWTRGVRWSGQELDCSPVAIPRPNHAGRKKTSFFFLEPPLNAQRSPDCGPEKRIISGEKEMKEGGQGTRRAGEAKEKEKRTKDQAPKKNVVLKRNT